jgi:hypothetical protein
MGRTLAETCSDNQESLLYDGEKYDALRARI